MIKYLRVQNLSIIRDVSLEFSPGLTVITGETGAGKSILVDSLGLLLGERADTERIRAGEGSALVEAVFDVSSQGALSSILKEQGFEAEDAELILRREILSEGRSRAFIAGRLASLSDLRKVGEALVDLHGQHDHQALLRTSEHLAILDRYCANEALLEGMSAARRDLEQAIGGMEALAKDRHELARRQDILRFQVEEIQRSEVKAGEMEALRSERLRVRNRKKIQELARSGLEALYEGEISALGVLERALVPARELSGYDPRVADSLPAAEEARLALKDLAEAMRGAGGGEEEGVGRLEEIEARLAQLESLLRKYGPDEVSVLAFLRKCEAELASLMSVEHSEEGLRSKIEAMSRECSRRASVLSARRQEGAKSLETAVKKELGDLALGGTDFRVDFRMEPQPAGTVLRNGEPVVCTTSGWDKVEFLLQANPGEDLVPLSRTASGGEISRIMLAIHLVLKKESEGTLRVFDEVDAGVGGKVAQAVGKKLRDLGKGGQVLCVTHLPQIASLASHHLRVSKRARHGRTEVWVDDLDRQGAVQEIARMLGGERISELTLRHAEEMVERGR
jgi:DNA repair protein RecN (Recombination protein N)